MLLALVDKRRDSSVIQVLESAADQRKPLTGKILNRWSEIELAIEPWLYCVLIGRDHIGAMTFQLQRADVIGNHFLGQDLVAGRTLTRPCPPDDERHQKQEGQCSNWEPTPVNRAPADFRLCLTMQRRPNALFQPLWGRITERAILESRTQRGLLVIGARADLAFLHVLPDLQTPVQIQLAMDVRVNQLLCCLTTQVKTSVCV